MINTKWELFKVQLKELIEQEQIELFKVRVNKVSSIIENYRYSTIAYKSKDYEYLMKVTSTIKLKGRLIDRLIKLGFQVNKVSGGIRLE